MTVSYAINHTLERMVTTFTGQVSARTLEDHAQRCVAEGTEGFEQVVDLQDAKLHLSTEDALRLAETLTQLPGKKKPGRTVIIARGPLNFGMTRMIASMIHEDYPLHVVHTVNEAEAWIGWKVKDARQAAS